MVKAQDFTTTMRGGVHAAQQSLVVHYYTGECSSTLVGFVVPKKQIPLASHRNRIKRRLRHITGGYLPELTGSHLVIRVKSGADQLTSSALETQLKTVLGKAKKKAAAGSVSGRKA